MALIRRLDNLGDWVYGHGKADYLTDNNCVGLNLVTKIKEWKYNCFFARLNGIDWTTRLGDKNQKELLDEDILDILAGDDEVESIEEYNSTLDTSVRLYTATARIKTIFGEEDLTFQVGGN